MSRFPNKFSSSIFSPAIRVVTLTLFLVIFGASAVLAQTKGYVTNGFNNTVSVIDTATNTVTATIPLAFTPSALAFTPNGAFLYVTHSFNSTVSVIDTATNMVTATIPVGSVPREIAITPNGAFAYVANAAAMSP